MASSSSHCHSQSHGRSHSQAPSFSDEDLSFSDHDAENDDDDDDPDCEDGDDKRLIAERAYQKYLPELQNFVCESCGSVKPNLVTDREEKSCAVCPTTQWFKGWKALLAHAGSFKKKRPHQHRGYHRALLEALRVNEKPSQDDFVNQGRAVSINPDVDKTHLIVWPPVVIIQTLERGRNMCERVTALLTAEFRDLHDTTCVAASPLSCFIVFKDEAIGYLEAQMVGRWFLDRRRGRDRLQRRGSSWTPIEEDGQPLLYGYLAAVEDMKYCDPERKFVRNWTEESYYEKVPNAQRKSKQEHDKEQAMLKAMELQVENLTEDEQKFKTNRAHIERLIEKKYKQIAYHKRRAEEMEHAYIVFLRKLDDKFQNEMKIFEAQSTGRVKRLREELELNERRLEEERANRKREIESLQKQFQTLTEDLKEKETKKALERELEVMEKKKKFIAEMAEKEALFNQSVREQESNLQEKQHREMMQLLKEANEEKERILKKWLEEQETLKKQEVREKEKAEESTDQAKECAVCLDGLDKDSRAAVLSPCGHARLCLDCAKEIFKEKGVCPICRVKIKAKPILLPTKLYM